MKFGSVRQLPIVGLFVLALLIAPSADAGIVWTEVGDAGDSLATANDPLGVGAIDAIIGTLPDQPADTNVDLFKIFIPDVSLFAATTDNFPATELFDSWLYLFDSGGLGVAASGSTVGGSFNATISQGSVSGPPGVYYLAVTRFETFPTSSSGPIFPDLVLESTNGEVVGSTGPGGSDPLASWVALDIFDFENYRIDLTGAEVASPPSNVVPEPSSFILWGVLLFVFLRPMKLVRRASAELVVV